MTQFKDYCLLALEEVEDAHSKGHLIYSDEYKTKHKLIPGSYNSLLVEFGLTSHTNLFTQDKNTKGIPVMCFRLNAKVSASDALRTLLTSGETVIDCGVGVLLTHIYACLLALEDRYGEEKGRLRFDLLFGSATHETPLVQRLLFSNNTVLSGTKEIGIIDPAGNVCPINPFSFIFGGSDLAHGSKKIIQKNDISKCHIGSILSLQGNQYYENKHPSGIAGNYNCIYVGKNKDSTPMFRVFGHGKSSESELDLKQRHVNNYNAEPDGDDQLRAHKYDPNFPKTITIRDVPGISIITNIDVKADVWEEFINAPLTNLMQSFIKHLNRVINEKMIELTKNKLPCVAEPSPTLRINNFYFPESLYREQRDLLLFMGGREKGRTANGMIKMELESSFLVKHIRDKTGIERRLMNKLEERQLKILAAIYPEATIEKSSEKYLLTFPNIFFSKVEKICTKLPALEKNIQTFQNAFRAKRKLLTL